MADKDVKPENNPRGMEYKKLYCNHLNDRIGINSNKDRSSYNPVSAVSPLNISNGIVVSLFVSISN